MPNPIKVWKQITINTKTLPELKKALKDVSNVSDYADDILDKIKFGKKQKLNLVRITVKDLGFETYATTTQIYLKAQELGLELCPPEVGPYLRLEYKDQPTNEWLRIAMKQISDRRGRPRVFGLGRSAGGLWLAGHWAEPTSKWNPGNEFVFCLRKLPLESLPEKTLCSFDPLKFSFEYDGKKYGIKEII